jgi:hypothetical protein
MPTPYGQSNAPKKLAELEKRAMKGPSKYDASGDPFHTDAMVISGHKVQIYVNDLKGTTRYEVDGNGGYNNRRAVLKAIE